jgi:uncharacterized protein YkwD
MSDTLPLQELSRVARSTVLAVVRRQPLSKSSLSKLSRADLVKQPGCGAKTAAEIIAWADRLGVTIGER